jgi:CheY-like chemotaxis protein
MGKCLEVIESAALDGAATVRRIFDFSRQQDDKASFTAVDLKMVIEGAFEFTQVRWEDEARLKNIEYTLKMCLPVLPMALGNPSELREVFINLIHNALDAMPQGGSIDITASADNDTIVILIKDTGHGIPQPIIDKIFDPFFTTKGPQSTGLGMSVSYGILSRHNGTISVASTEGIGTLFTITLPVTQVQSNQETQIPERAPSRKASILVVDDEDDVRDVLHDILSAEGHQVECADCGKNAVLLCENNTYDIVFTDLGMPGMSGWQVAEAVKRIDCSTFVILLTGWDVQKNKSDIDKSKVDYIINKPFQIDTILQMIKTVELRKQNQPVE